LQTLETQEVQLVVPLHQKRAKSRRFSLQEPFKEPPEPVRTVKNIVAQALAYRDYLAKHPKDTYEQTGQHFGVSRVRISQLMTMVNRLPAALIDKLKDCEDPGVLRNFSGKRLMRIVKTRQKS